MAVDDGLLILFNDDLGGDHVKYCPDRGHRFQDQVKETGKIGIDQGCVMLVTVNSGRTILILHETFEGKFITKYAHLKEGSIAAKFQSATSPDAAVAVRRGEKIGKLGSSIVYPEFLIEANDFRACELFRAQLRLTEPGCRGTITVVDPTAPPERDERFDGSCALENGFPDAHIHFEIRMVDAESGRWTEVWKTTAHRCWTNSDPEQPYIGGPVNEVLLVGAGFDCGWSPNRLIRTVVDVEDRLPPLPASTVPRDPGGLWDNRIREVRDNNIGRRVFEVTSANSANEYLTATVSTAFWRPLFYSRYNVQPPRTQTSGIAGTRSGVDRYFSEVWRPPFTPAQPQSALGPVTGVTEGELPRHDRTVRISAGAYCNLRVATGNRSHGTPDPGTGQLLAPRINIELSDPQARLQYNGPIEPGLNEGRLSGVDFHFYRVDTRVHERHVVCAAMTADACDTELPGHDTTFELFGPNGESLQTSEGSQLSWTSNAGGTYVVMVRGGYAKQALTDLEYEAGLENPPFDGACELHYAKTCPVDYCPKPPDTPTNPTASAVTGSAATLNWESADSDVEFEYRRVEGNVDAGANCETGLSPGASLASTTGHAQRFTMLDAAKDYLFCVRAVRAAGTPPIEIKLRSAWASAPSRPEVPANPDVVDLTTSSLKLTWDEVTGLSYKVQIDDGGELTPDTNSHHRFSPLEEGSSHDLQVRAIPGTLKSAWTRPLNETTLTTTCADQPNRPETDPRTATPQTQYVLSDDRQSAQQQTRTGTDHYARTLVRQSHPVCAYTDPPWV